MNMNKERVRVVFTPVSNQGSNETAYKVRQYYKQKKELAKKHRKLLSASVSISTEFDMTLRQSTPEVITQNTPEIVYKSGLFTPVQKVSIQIEKNTQKVRSLIESRKLARYSANYQEYMIESLEGNKLKTSSGSCNRRYASRIQPKLDNFMQGSTGMSYSGNVDRFLGRRLTSHKLPVSNYELECKYIPLSRTRRYPTTPKRFEKSSP